MLLGKRSRPTMRRTTSSLEFPDGGVSFDVEAPQPLDQGGESIGGAAEVARRAVDVAGTDWRAARFVGSMLSPRGGVQRSNPVELSGDNPGTAPFLRACGLCNRRLGPGRDAFMYRGEIAFCSLECRQEHMSQDVPSAAQEP